VVSGLLIFRSLTRGFIQSPIMTVTMATLPDHQVRLGAGLRGLLNSLGGTFGIAFAGIELQQRLAVRTISLLENEHCASFEHTYLSSRSISGLPRRGKIPPS
jgi:hypothetical protein